MIEDLSLHLADLVLNSLRAGARCVGILIAKRGETLMLQVEDDGRGMSEDELRRALDPFFTTKDVPDGIGLGLALVQQTAAELGGRLRVDSAPGRGTRVWLSIPYAHPDRPPLGDIAGTLVPLMLSNPEVEFSLRLEDDQRKWTLTQRDIRAVQDEVGPRALFVLEGMVRTGLRTVGLKEDG
ncbi:TPA: ATP-binding protein [Candidatus Bipolaricaulota bacterium]|nr:ATP-binding protein [Candidatus Bipolaricaulota bacterium]